MQLDVLAFGAHPDDVELSCSGSLYKLKQQGKRIGVVDLTRGELGTRGTAQTREEEAKAASDILQLDARVNLDLGDGWFEVNKENKLKVIEVIRHFRPTLVLANAVDDRHIDHPRAAELVKDAVFLSGLRQIETAYDGQPQEAFRPDHLFHYIQYHYMRPDFVIDITDQFERKMDSIKAYKTQFYSPHSNEPQTPISSERFLHSLESRAREFGAVIGRDFGEGFVSSTPLPYDLNSLL